MSVDIETRHFRQPIFQLSAKTGDFGPVISARQKKRDMRDFIGYETGR